MTINCMVVSKACFTVLLGLDMMKPLGAIIDLQQDMFTFTDHKTHQWVKVALQCGRVVKTLSDVKMVAQVHEVRMLKPIPAMQGPMTGQTFFPGLDVLSPTAETTLQEHRVTPSMKMSNRLKTRPLLKEKKVKKEKSFPEGAEINPELTAEQRQRVLDILVQFRDVFIPDTTTLPCTDLEEHYIDTGTDAPIYIPPYRCSKAEEEVIQREVDEMLALGIIRESRSPWVASAVLVTKKTGEWRLCMDYQALNRVTKKESYPIPLIDDMLNAVGRSFWFTLIDLRTAYWQIRMEQSSICKTAFSTQKGHYEFLRMPFGLVWAVLRFQGFADKVLKPISDICRAYLDDFLTHASSFEGACQGLVKVSTVLREAKLTASFSKCRFLMRETPYLGFLLTREGVKIDPAKTDAIRNLQAPTDVASLQHVLGLYQHYARFHPGFAEVAVPLSDLTQKNRPWVWTSACQAAFDMIKANLVAEPFLMRPDFTKPFIIQTDWSPTALASAGSDVRQSSYGRQL